MISVIGAGPAGSFYAANEKSDEVHLFEEHEVVGKPVACTGILTDSISRVTQIDPSLIVSKINSFKIVAPSGKSISIDLKKTNLVLDRARFDQWLFQKAVDNGAKVHLGERFLGYKEEGKKLIIKTSKKTYESNALVGADGPQSQVAKSAGIYGDRKFVMGWQARCKFPNLEEGVTEIRMGVGEFAWVVPESRDTARIGIGTSMSENAQEALKKFLNWSSAQYHLHYRAYQRLSCTHLLSYS